MKTAFIGLGSMGAPMARLLLDAGFDVTVYNRSADKARPLQEAGAKVADSPRQAAEGAQLLITMVADDAALKAVLHGGDGALAALPAQAIHVSMSTISVALASELDAQHRESGWRYIAAPVFGRPDAAAAKKLWVLAAGGADAISEARPALEAMGQGVIELGEEATRANTVKLAGNYMISSMMEALGEAFTLSRKAGVEAEEFLQIINKVFRSPVYENYGRQIANEQFSPAGFKLRLGLKDLRLVLAAADDAQAPMPLASLLHDRYLGAVARGESELDWSALARLCADDAGLPRRS